MKKLTFILMAAALVFASCSKELVNESEPAVQEEGVYTRTFNLSFSEETKAVYAGQGKIDWEAGDVISYITYLGETPKTATVETAGHTATVTVELSSQSMMLIALYGASDIAIDLLNMKVSATGMTCKQNGTLKDGQLAYALVESLSSNELVFTTYTSHVQFTVTNPDVKRVCFSAYGTEKIAPLEGEKLVLSLGGEVPSLSAGKADGKEGTGSMVVDLAVPGPGTYYVNLFPVTLGTGFQLNMYDAKDKNIGWYAYNKNIYLGVNGLLKLGTIDSHLTAVTTTVPNAETRALAAEAGHDLSKYDEIAVPLQYFSYYNSSNGTSISKLISKDNGSTAANVAAFAATPIFDKGQLPNGTLLVVKSGYQYRPEGWYGLNSANSSSSRPGNVTRTVTEINDSWWASWIYRGFNIAKANNPNLTLADMVTLKDAFSIFVPKVVVDESKMTAEEIFESKGYNKADYNKLAIDWTQKAYYYSSSDNLSNKVTTANNSPQFCCTQIFEKSQIPNGSVIVIASKYQYRPEAWVTLDTKNGSDRPGNVSTTITVVNDSWWDKWNYRGFNIAKVPAADYTNDELAAVEDKFAIFVPKN